MKRYINKVLKAVSLDGWSNNSTGVGVSNSRVNSTRYNPIGTLDRDTLSSLYRNDGIAKKVVNLIVDDSTRGFINAEEELIEELDRINFKQNLIDCASFGRLYGGSVIVAFSDDGSPMEKPINLKRLKKVVKLAVYDRYDVNWDPESINQNYYDESFKEPTVYDITNGDGQSFKVHCSRCFILGGIITTNDTKRSNGGWDDSVIQPIYEAILNYGSVKSNCAEVVQDYIQKVLSVDGLLNLISSGNASNIKNRLKNLDLQLSNAQLLLIDSKEKYEKHTSSVSGLAELWDKFSEALSATSGIPITRLFGKSAGGLNAHSDNDIKNWHDVVSTYRSDYLRPCYDWMIEMLSAQAMWNQDSRPSNYDWTFASLEEPNDEQEANVKLITAQTDNIYTGMGAIDPRVLYSLRYEGGWFNKDIEIPEGLLDDDLNDDLSGNEDLLEVDIVEKVETVEAIDSDDTSSINRRSKVYRDNKIKILSNIMDYLNDGQ